MKKTKMLKGSIMKEIKMLKGRIMKKTRIPRSNILRNIISKKRTCGKISCAKVALKRARKYSIKSRARKCAHKRFRYSLSEPKPFAKNKYIQNIKKVVSCDMKFMKELKDIFKTQQSST